MRVASPFARSPSRQRLARRAVLLQVQSLAPRHPPGPEAHLRLIMASLARSLDAAVKAEALERARSHRADAPRPKTVARRALRKQVKGVADQIAKSAHEQVARTLGVNSADLDIDLSEHVYGLVDSIVRIAEDYEIEASKRVSSTLGEWMDLDPDRSPRAGDFDALGDMIDDSLDGAFGRMQQSVRMAFGQSFADMNQAVQVQAGVEQYMWITMSDSHVRPEHMALHAQVCSWDDPPLTAEESSNGEDCHPGDDWECRCVASPVPASVEGATNQTGEDD